MQEVIQEWYRSKPYVSIIKNYKQFGLFNYRVICFLGTDNKYYEANIVYTETRVLGSLDALKDNKILRLGGSETVVPETDWERLDATLRCFNSKEELAEYKSPDVSKQLLDKLVNAYLQRVYQGIYEGNTENLLVENVHMPSGREPIVYVYYRAHGKAQAPLRILLGEPTPVSRSLGGRNNAEFLQFAENICAGTGGLVFY